MIDVERNRDDIKHSENATIWEIIITAPTEDVTWDFVFALFERASSVR